MPTSLEEAAPNLDRIAAGSVICYQVDSDSEEVMDTANDGSRDPSIKGGTLVHKIRIGSLRCNPGISRTKVQVLLVLPSAEKCSDQKI